MPTSDNSANNLAITIPFILLIIGFFSIPFSPTLNSLIMLTGLWSIVYPPARAKLQLYIKQPFFWWGLAFFIWIVIRMVGGAPIPLFIKKQYFFHYFNNFLPIVLLPPLIKNVKQQQTIFIAVIISAILISFGLFIANHHAFTLSHTAFFQLAIFKKAEIEPLAILYVLAIYLTATLCYRHKKNKGIVAVGAIIILWLMYFIVFKQSERVALVTLAVMIFYFLLTHFNKTQASILSILIIAISVIVLALFPNTITYKFYKTEQQIETHVVTHAQTSTLPVRLQWYHYGWQLAKQKPVTGYGTGTFNGGRGLYIAPRPDPTMSHYHVTPENNYLAIQLALGAIGLMLFIFFILSLWRFTNKLSKENKTHARGLMITCLVAALFFPAFTLNISALLFSGLLGICFSSINTQETSDENH